MSAPPSGTALVAGMRLIELHFDSAQTEDICSAKWDPNATASTGISSNNGVFTYTCLSGATIASIQVGLGVFPFTRVSEYQEPTPVNRKWIDFDFIPSVSGAIVFLASQSNQIFMHSCRPLIRASLPHMRSHTGRPMAHLSL